MDFQVYIFRMIDKQCKVRTLWNQQMDLCQVVWNKSVLKGLECVGIISSPAHKNLLMGVSYSTNKIVDMWKKSFQTLKENITNYYYCDYFPLSNYFKDDNVPCFKTKN